MSNDDNSNRTEVELNEELPLDPSVVAEALEEAHDNTDSERDADLPWYLDW